MTLASRSSASFVDVAISGLGIVSPIGVGREAVLESLRIGATGVRLRADQPDPWSLAAYIPDSFDPKLWVQPRKSLKLMSHEIQLGVAAAAMAIHDAGITEGHFDPERIGVVLGTDIMHCLPTELVDTYMACRDVAGQFQFAQWADQAKRQLNPLWMLKYLPNMAASHVAIAHDARGPSNTLVLGAVSSLLAIIEAAGIVATGRADAMLAGGTGSQRNPTTRLYHGTDHLSRRKSEPIATPRPFAIDRDGTVAGEGAGVLLLERLDRAQQRGARILGIVRGYGRAMTAWPAPDCTTAIEHSLQQTLRSAGWKPEELSHLNATGRATLEDDRREALGIRRALGEVPVFAPSAAFGSLGAASGAVELSCSLLALSAGLVPPPPFPSQLDPQCPIVPWDASTTRDSRKLVKLGQVGTGQAAALAIEMSPAGDN